MVPKSRYRTGNVDNEKLFADYPYFKRMMKIDKAGVIRALESRYPLVSPDYIEDYINHIYREHLENPQATLYIESELGAPQRQMDLITQLNKNGYRTKNKKCLDIGCNNGALVLACWKSGASDVMGIDISEKRLEKAKRFSQGKPIRIKKHNILENLIGETFDVILSTDVLEHVAEPEKFFHRLQTHLKRSPTAFIYLSLFNKYYPDNIISEPHFDVPGMILLPFGEAEELWYQVRQDYNSILDYEVYHWHSYWEYREMANRAGLEMIPFQNKATVSASIRRIENYKNISANFETQFNKKLDASPVPVPFRDKITRRVRTYLKEFRKEHDRFLEESARDYNKYNKIEYLYLKYHAQPLVMICRHKETG